MMKDRAIRLSAALAAMTGLLVATAMGQAMCAYSDLCVGTQQCTSVAFNNTGCGAGTYVGKVSGYSDLIGAGTGTLTQVRYGVAILLISNINGDALGSNGENNARFSCAMNNCSTDSEPADISVGTATCSCVSGLVYHGTYQVSYNYNSNTNQYMGMEAISGANSTAP